MAIIKLCMYAVQEISYVCSYACVLSRYVVIIISRIAIYRKRKKLADLIFGEWWKIWDWRDFKLAKSH